MAETGWVPDELAASAEARQLSEVLFAGPSFAERQQIRREREAEAERADRAQSAADALDTRRQLARLRGESMPTTDDVLSRAEPVFRGDAERRHRAIAILREHGLEDQITGGSSGVILDANIGVIEPERGSARRSAADEDDRALQRAEAEAAAGREWMARYRARHRGEVARSSADVERVARTYGPNVAEAPYTGWDEVWRADAADGVIRRGVEGAFVSLR